MTASLPQVSLEHHDRLMHHLDAMTAVGDLVGAAPVEELRPRVDEMAAFLNGLLHSAHGGGRAHPLSRAGADAPEPALDDPDAARAR